MHDRQLRNRIDKLWEAFWTGGITNPLTVIEQISFLMFARLLDITESRNEKRSKRTGKRHRGLFKRDEQHLRWSHFRHMEEPEEMLKLLRDEVFPHFKRLGKAAGDGDRSILAEYMQDAQLMIQKPSLLVQAVNQVDELPLTEGDAKGDLYEYLLSKLTTAGINGQFRTPRHIIRFMAELVDPKPYEKIGDPACGTGGFLVGALQHVLEQHTSPQGVIEHEDGQKTYTGDLLGKHWDHIRTSMLYGFDFDSTMLRTAVMNLLLHGVDHPEVHYQDTLARSFSEGKNSEFAKGYFDVILANPPFTGSIDLEDLDPSLSGQIKTKKTELLFVSLILRMLRPGGRAAMIVPDGVLFGSSKAHVELRKMLVEAHQLEGVFSLPSGVFRPYAGVSTAVLAYTKGGKTENVFFFDVEADGYSLDDKRLPIEDNDLDDAVECWTGREPGRDTDRTEKAFFVPADEIRRKGYDLTISRYKEASYQNVTYRDPKEILLNLHEIEKEIKDDLEAIESLMS